MEEEIWKDVVGYENLYKVSNFGRILQKAYLDKRGHKIKEKIKSTKTNSHCYESFGLADGHHRLYVHRVVATAFCDNPNNYKQVNHLDGNKRNNKASNLEWCSALQNIRHSRNVLKVHPEDAIKKRIFCVELQRWFDSVIEIHKYFGLSGNSMNGIIDKPNRVLNGYHFTSKEIPYIETKYTSFRKKWVVCIETGERCLGVGVLARRLGVTCSTLREAIHKGTRCKGRHYKYID